MITVATDIFNGSAFYLNTDFVLDESHLAIALKIDGVDKAQLAGRYKLWFKPAASFDSDLVKVDVQAAIRCE